MAERLFEALGRKDAAAAIANALAALDRKDYATAQGLFQALGKTGPGVRRRADGGRRPRRPPSPRHRRWVRYRSGSAARRTETSNNAAQVIPLPDAAYRQSLPQAKKAKRAV